MRIFSTLSVLLAAAFLMAGGAQAQLGSLDTSFDPGTGANGRVSAVAVQSNGKVLIGGDFTSVDGANRPYLARLNDNGSVDATFAPVGLGPVKALAIQSDGKIVLQSSGWLGRLNLDGSWDTTFGNQGSVAGVGAFFLQCDGKFIVGGTGVRRLNSDGTLDLEFPGAGDLSQVSAVFTQPDGKVIASGLEPVFLPMGVYGFGSHRFNIDGSVDSTYSRAFETIGTVFALQADGSIIFSGFNFGRLTPDGSLDTNFNAVTDVTHPFGGVLAMAIQSDQKIVVGGFFFDVRGVPRNSIARLNPDGSLDDIFAPGTSVGWQILSIAIDSPGRVLIAGQFSSVDGKPRNGIARLQASDSTAFDSCRTSQPTNQSPTIVYEPSSVDVLESSTATFGVGVTATLPVSYQWYFNGQPIAGALGSVFTIPKAQLGDAGRYSVVVSNSFGSATSPDAILAVGYSLTVSTRGNGTLQVNPRQRVYLSGSTVELTAIVSSGRQFSGWLGDASGSTNPLTVVMDGNKNITAQFEYFPGDTKWVFQTGSPYEVISTPALGPDGTVYFGADAIYALDGVTGAKKWQFTLDAPLAYPWVTSPALGSDGTVYAGSEDGYLYALDGATGVMKWRFPTGGEITCSPAVAQDNTVYTGSNDGKLHAIDGATGGKKWEFPTGNIIESSPAIGPDGTVYFGSADNKVYALDGATGAKKWELLTDLAVPSSPAIGTDATVFIGSADGRFFALDGGTGAKKWEFAAGGSVYPSPVLGVDGTVYISSLDSALHALDGVTGRAKWESPFGSWGAAAVGADGTIYIASGKLHGIDAATGTNKWESTDSIHYKASPAVGSDGTIYVASAASGTLFALQGSGGLADSPWPKFRGDKRNTAAAKSDPQPIIVSPPTSVTVAEFSSTTFGVVAGGTQPLSYQWYFNQAAIVGAVDSILRVSSVQFTNAGNYSVVVSNSVGIVASAGAVLTVGYALETYTRGLGGVQRSPDLPVYPPNSTVELTAVETRGRRFLGWFGDANGSTKSVVVTLDRNKQVTAQFQAPTPSILWTFQTLDQVLSCPAVGDDGSIYVGSNDGNVYALDGFSGRKIWQFATGGAVVASPALGVSGLVYVGSFDNRMYALDMATGTKHWEFATDGQISSSAAVGQDGTVYVGSEDKKVYALDGSTGAKKWEFPTGGNVRSSPAVGTDSAVYVFSRDGIVYCLDGATGLKKWEFQTGSSFDLDFSSPSLSEDETICLVGNLVGLFALDAATGSLKWSSTERLLKNSPVWSKSGTAYFGATTGSFFALDGLTGAKKWEWSVLSGGTVYSSAALGANGTIFIVNDGIYALDSASGTLDWQLRIGDPHWWVYSPLALGLNGELYVGTYDKRLLAIQVGTSLADSAWPKFRGNNRNTGRVNVKIVAPPLQSPIMSGQTFQFSMPTQLGGNYQLEFKNLLTDPVWVPLADVIKGDGTVKAVTDSAVDGTQRFYRVRVK